MGLNGWAVLLNREQELDAARRVGVGADVVLGCAGHDECLDGAEEGREVCWAVRHHTSTIEVQLLPRELYTSSVKI